MIFIRYFLLDLVFFIYFLIKLNELMKYKYKILTPCFL